MKQFLAAVLVAVLVIPSPVLAHGGRTDASGGHTDHSTGEYHYHHGYSAHQHPNGVCPYNFDDQTDHSSGTTSGNSSSSGSSSWVYVDSHFFEGFRYNESTDEWLHDDGTYYESSAELFDCYGFYYNSLLDVWYNEDGYIDEDFCVRDHSDGGYFYCRSCEILMYDFESDSPEYHYDECAYIEEIVGYEDESDRDYSDIDYTPSNSSPNDSITFRDVITFLLNVLRFIVEFVLSYALCYVPILLIIGLILLPDFLKDLFLKLKSKIRNRKK